MQLAALPVAVSMVQALPSSQLVGQEPGGSQVSPGSTSELLQVPVQSRSLFASQPPGQQPSPLVHCVMIWLEHATLQFIALPVSASIVQALPSSQLVWQDSGGSQVSPASSVPFPQVTVQSESFAALQPRGQHSSAFMQVVTG